MSKPAKGADWMQYGVAKVGTSCVYSLHVSVPNLTEKATFTRRAVSETTSTRGLSILVAERERGAITTSGTTTHVDVSNTVTYLFRKDGTLGLRPGATTSGGLQLSTVNYENIPAVASLASGRPFHGVIKAQLTPTSSAMKKAFDPMLLDVASPISLSISYRVTNAKPLFVVTLPAGRFSDVIGYQIKITGLTTGNVTRAAQGQLGASLQGLYARFDQTIFHAKNIGMIEDVGTFMTKKLLHCS